jgi:hypothetical protein
MIDNVALAYMHAHREWYVNMMYGMSTLCMHYTLTLWCKHYQSCMLQHVAPQNLDSQQQQYDHQ